MAEPAASRTGSEAFSDAQIARTAKEKANSAFIRVANFSSTQQVPIIVRMYVCD
jgi:hypothetical protein